MKIIGHEKYGAIYSRIRLIISEKSSFAYVFSHSYAKIKINSIDSLTLEEILTLQNAMTLIKSVFNKDQNHCHYNYFLEKRLYQLAKKH